MERDEHIPQIVNQALAWLDNMNIEYQYFEDGDFWNFRYKGLTIDLINSVDDNILAIYAPCLVLDENYDIIEDDKICRMTYDMALRMAKDDKLDCDLDYYGNGLAMVSQWWEFTRPRKKLYKYKFIEHLKIISDLHNKFQFLLDLSYNAMFNPPKEVVEEVFRNAGIIDNENQDNEHQ